MKLFYAPAACSLAQHIVAREADLPVEMVKVEFGANGRTAGGRNYYDINPMGAVPALELADGQVLTENAVLLQYLAAQKPSANLAPSGADMEHWRFLELLNFIATELHKGFSPLFKNPPAEWREQVIANLKNRLGLLEHKLGDKPYLWGDHFTVADAYTFVILNWAHAKNVELTAKLEAYFQRMKARPGVQIALKEEGLA
jgi:glutathione S-transferase